MSKELNEEEKAAVAAAVEKAKIGEPAKAKPDEPRYKDVTLGELGFRLPVGILQDGTYYRDIALRDFRLEEEEQINRIREKERGLTLGKQIAEVLAVLCTQLGSHDFSTMAISEKRLVITRMHMMDVLYSYVMARCDSLGYDMALCISCPACRHQFDVKVDLKELDVVALENEKEANLTFTFDLRHEITVRGEAVRQLRIGNITWEAMDTKGLGSILNPTVRDMAMLRGSINGTDRHKEFIRLTDDELRQLHKYDKEGLSDEITQRMPGPKLFIEADCPRCGSAMVQPIEWTFELFFARSSRSSRRRT